MNLALWLHDVWKLAKITLFFSPPFTLRLGMLEKGQINTAEESLVSIEHCPFITWKLFVTFPRVSWSHHSGACNV